MKLKIQKWGNSMALRLPRLITRQINVREGSPVDFAVSRGKLIIFPLSSGRKKYRLSDLVAKISDENLHAETDTGLPVGGEVW